MQPDERQQHVPARIRRFEVTLNGNRESTPAVMSRSDAGVYTGSPVTAGGGKHALFIEVFPSHGELFFAHGKLLKQLGYSVTAAINAGHLTRAAATDNFERVHPLSAKQGGATMRSLLHVHRLMHRERPDLVFVNSFRSKQIGMLVYGAPAGVPLLGVHHNPHKLWQSAVHRSLAARARLLVSSARAKRMVHAHRPDLRVEVLYPVFSPQAPRAAPPAPPWTIAIPGALQSRKRAYDWLIREVEQRRDSFRSIVFTLLGNASHGEGPALVARIRRAGLCAHFRWWDDFLSEEEYRSELQKAHAVLPLIHPSSNLARYFHTVKTSGAINAAYRQRRWLLLEEHFCATSSGAAKKRERNACLPSSHRAPCPSWTRAR